MISCEVIRDRQVVENTELLFFTTSGIFLRADPGNSIRSFLTEQQSLSVSEERRQQPKSKESEKIFMMPKTLPKEQTSRLLPVLLDFCTCQSQRCYYQTGGPR